MISTKENEGGAVTLQEIEQLTREFAAEHRELCSLLKGYSDEIAEVNARWRAEMARTLQEASQARDALQLLISEGKHLFESPRTRVFDGIKVGIQKSKGSIEVPNEARTVELIKKHFPDTFAAFIRTTEAPDKKMLEEMAVTDLKRVGCQVTDAVDRVVIKPVANDIEKAVQAIVAADKKEVAE